MSIDSSDREQLRQEIQAAIAAGRDLDPAMDRHLADSILDRYEQDRAIQARIQAKTTPQVVAPRQPSHVAESIGRTVSILAAAGIFITIMILSHGWLWWMFFPMMGMMGGFWGRRRQGYHDWHPEENQPESNEEVELKRRERIAKRKLKIRELEDEVARLERKQDYV